MPQQPDFVKVWDVSGGYVMSEDSQIMGALGLDREGMLHVVASETEDADETLEQVCDRVNAMKTLHVRKAASDGSVFTSEAYVFNRADDGFAGALENHLTQREFLRLHPFKSDSA